VSTVHKGLEILLEKVRRNLWVNTVMKRVFSWTMSQKETTKKGNFEGENGGKKNGERYFVSQNRRIPLNSGQRGSQEDP
jgi:hypothetical protein